MGFRLPLLFRYRLFRFKMDQPAALVGKGSFLALCDNFIEERIVFSVCNGGLPVYRDPAIKRNITE